MNLTTKNVLITAFLAIVIGPVFAQNKGAAPQASKNCYGEWFTLFRSRGAEPVADGTQDVVISLRSGDASHCFMGRVEVMGGKMKLPLMIQKQDGSYDTFGSTGKKLDPSFTTTMTEDELLTITDGMSVSFRTTDQETGRIFFYKSLSAKPKGNKIAPPPSVLVKD